MEELLPPSSVHSLPSTRGLPLVIFEALLPNLAKANRSSRSYLTAPLETYFGLLGQYLNRRQTWSCMSWPTL
ncbi:hypothetical protein NC653_020135 [Populus alba x Populus x berolinensis]|uniref:Uncharacterized protein n=1 Tax=Populus alba x Populus x berolinensis TaxID=444605 RepID=A0AAD6MKG3_9ROSI|nr:hypothetical protein NC653_020135 [Populus alba x Populus x berolinensis]